MSIDNWIDVRNESPADWDRVMVTSNDIVSQWVEILVFDREDGCWRFEDGDLYPAIVTHWMPLPNPHGE